MDELVKLVSEKTGIPEDQARIAVETVLGFMKQKLPAPVAAQVDALLSDSTGGGLDGAIRGLGGLFGQK